MRHSPHRAVFVLAVAAMSLSIQPAAANPSHSEIFSQAEAICRADSATLWGVALCGRLLLVEPATRTVFANQPDEQNILRREGEIFTGKLPNEINVANTAVDRAGVKWTMIMLPLPADEHRRAALIAHEMWHRIQDDLGLNPANLVVLEPHGTVYPDIRIVDGWGVLTVTTGRCAMSSDFTEVDRIARHPRHRTADVLLEGETADRDFADWSMGFQNMDEENCALDSGLLLLPSGQVLRLDFASDPSRAHQLLRIFRRM